METSLEITSVTISMCIVYVCAYCVLCVCACTLCHGVCSRYINKPKPYYKMFVQYLKHIL